MAVKTSISESDLPAIVGTYDIGSYSGFRSFANGAGQTTLLLQTSRGEFVLRYYENRSEQHVGFEVRLLAFLLERRFPVPAIIKNRSGQLLSHYRGKPYILTTFITGEHSPNPNERLDTSRLAAIVESVAQLHHVTRDYHPQYFLDREAYDTIYCWRQFQNRHRDLVTTEVGRWFKAELDCLVFPAELPRGLCHADLNAGNFLLRENAVVGVLDFDMSFYGPLVYDIASLIYWWALPPGQSLRDETASFIITEYDKHRSLSESERAHIFDALKLLVLLGISWGDASEILDERRRIAMLTSSRAAIFR